MGHRTKVCISCTHWLCIVIFFRFETPRESKFLPLKFRSINLIKLRLGPIYCNNFNSVWKGTGFEMFPWQNHRILFFAFSDSDWAGCPLTRRSTTCFVTLARQQYYLLDISKTTCSCLFVYRGWISSSCFFSCWTNLVGVSCSRSSCKTFWGPVFHSRLKHIELDLHDVRERVAMKALQTRFIDLSTCGHLHQIIISKFIQ